MDELWRELKETYGHGANEMWLVYSIWLCAQPLCTAWGPTKQSKSQRENINANKNDNINDKDNHNENTNENDNHKNDHES